MIATDKPYIKMYEFSHIQVYLAPEQKVQLGTLWRKQTAILVFLRHFACIACRAHASQIWNERDKYQKSGAKIIFIGNGEPEWIQKFSEDLGIDKAVILTDPSLKAFKAAGFKNGFFNLVQPKSVINAAKLAAQGHVQTSYSKEAGSHFQMGGIVVINPKNKVLYHYISESLGDFPEEPYIEVIKKDEEQQ